MCDKNLKFLSSKSKTPPSYFSYYFISGVNQEGSLTRKGASCSMQQVWEELTGKHYGCNIGDTCTHRTDSHLHNKQ